MKARTKLACSIAGLDPQKMNEAVHFGHLTCVPETSPGVARAFDVDQIVTLMIFANLTRNGMSSAQAGAIACAIAFNIVPHQDPALKFARYWFLPENEDDTSGVHRRGTVRLYGENLNEPLIENTDTRDVSQVFDYSTISITVPVGTMRRIVKGLLENQIVGEE